MVQPIRARGSSLRSGMLLGVLLVGTAMFVIGPQRLVEPAMAQIPDSGLQRKQILAEARRANQLLGEIKQLLTTIAREEADKKKGGR